MRRLVDEDIMLVVFFCFLSVLEHRMTPPLSMSVDIEPLLKLVA